MTKYTEITNSRLQARVCARYATHLAALEALGFRRLAFKLEYRGPFSALLYLPLLPLMRRAKEFLVFPFPLRLAVANPLLVHAEASSIATCMGLGVKFYTNFSDHSLLISSTVLSHASLRDSGGQNPQSLIVRNPPCGTVDEAWLLHKRRTAELEADGRTRGSTASFADYIAISDREEADLRHAESSIP